jgi:hypothetical protein
MLTQGPGANPGDLLGQRIENFDDLFMIRAGRHLVQKNMPNHGALAPLTLLLGYVYFDTELSKSYDHCKQLSTGAFLECLDDCSSKWSR